MKNSHRSTSVQHQFWQSFQLNNTPATPLVYRVCACQLMYINDKPNKYIYMMTSQMNIYTSLVGNKYVFIDINLCVYNLVLHIYRK